MFDYLLKPFDKEELKEALGKCIKDIEESRKNKHLRQEMLLRDAVEAQPELFDMEGRASRAKGSHYRVSILRIQKGCGDYDIAVIRELLEFYLGRAGIGSYCLKNDGSCVTIAHVTDNKDGVMERIRKAYESLLEDENAAILDSAALSCVEEGLDHLQETYRQARLVYENSTKVHRRVAAMRT